ncbi:TcpD family membrane protein [Enterococcus hirae]
MKLKRLQFMNSLKNTKFLKAKVCIGTLAVNGLFSMPVLAADPSAKSFTEYVLSDWVSPIFALGVVFLVVKLFMSQDWVKGALLLVGGAVVYFLIKDPQSFLDTLSTIPEKFGF